MTDAAATAIRDHLVEHRARLVKDLAAWVRIPSVSALPSHRIDVMRSARWLTGHLHETGFPHVEQLDGPGLPAVLGRWPSDDPVAPTLLMYSHHDVRSARPANWEETHPFRPIRRTGRLYGRGASDAKGQILSHLWGVRAHLAATGRRTPAVNLLLLIEGEEEIGSPNLARLLQENADRLAPDAVVVSDTQLWSAHDPAVCTGVRGMVSARLEIHGPRRDVHSGMVSGAAPNPLTELSRLLGRLHDDHGRITLPGFYDPVAEITPEQREELARIPFDTADWLERTQTGSVSGEEGHTVLERVWLRPSAEVETLSGGDPSGPSRGVIPASASAELVFHLVPDQQVEQVERQFREWVDAEVKAGYTHEITLSPTNAEPYVTPPGHPALAALRRAMGRAYDRPPGWMRNGAGAPAALLARTLGAPVLFFGTGLPEDHWHEADEKTDIAVLLKGAETVAHLLTDLAENPW